MSRTFTADSIAKGATASVAVRKIRKAEAYAAIAPVIHDLRSSGRSLRAIARELTARGERTRSGRLWSGVQVKRALAMPLPARIPCAPSTASPAPVVACTTYTMAYRGGAQCVCGVMWSRHPRPEKSVI